MSVPIPPGQAALALRLGQLPQPHSDDCFVDLDPLVMAGFNFAADRLGKTVDEIANEAAYLWLRFFFEEMEQAKGPEGSAPSDLDH
jgi:hypothetical protein